MERFYKTERTSCTGVKIQEVKERIDLFNKNYESLKEKYGISDRHYRSSFHIKGILAVRFDKKEPDPKLWKKVTRTEGYYPKKCNKEAYSDFENIGAIARRDVDLIIGNDFPSIHQCGFNIDNDDIFLFCVSDEWRVNIPDDLTEISNIEYGKILKDIERKYYEK